MSISSEKKLEILHTHYQETFSYIREYIKTRERLFLIALIVVFIQFLQISFSGQYIEAFNTFIEKQFNISIAFNKEFINSMLWFLLFSVTLKYFQINVLINKQYDYIHSLEDKICVLTNDNNFIRREGQSYLNNYPVLSDWAHIIYTWVFPLLLIIVALVKIILEYIARDQYSCKLFLGEIFFLSICITTILYLVNIHKKKQKQNLYQTTLTFLLLPFWAGRNCL